jgi:DNA-binding MarR family transcriptional regulator
MVHIIDHSAPSTLLAMPHRPSASNTQETPAGHLLASGLKHVLGYQLAQAAVVCNTIFMREVGGPHGLRPVEYTVLQLIAENPGCSSVRLAKALAVTKPNITMWVDRLVGRNLVQRSASDTDKRSHELRVTAEGMALVERATASLEAGEASALTHLSQGERFILAELLRKLSLTPAR